MISIDNQGRYILAGATTFINFVAGTGNPPVVGEIPPGTPVAGSPTTMGLIDFYSSHQYARPVVQRRAGTEYGNVPVLFNYTGTAPGNPQARVINAVGGVVVKDWTTLANISVTGSTGLGTLPSVPQGGYYLLELRDGHNPSTSATNSAGTKQWGVGVVFLVMGQSNMAGTMGSGAFNDPVPDTATNEYDYWYAGNVAGTVFGSSGYVHPNNGTPGTGSNVGSMSGGTASTLRIISKALETKHGKKIPVGMVGWAFNSHSIGAFLPGGTRYIEMFQDAGTTADNIGLKSPGNISAGGDFEGFVWHQGEGDSSRTRAAYLADLKALYQAMLDFVAPFGRTANDLFFLPAILGVYKDDGTLSIENIRGAVLDLDAYARTNNWPRVRAGWNCIDLVPPETNKLHFEDIPGGNQYARWSCKRMNQSVLWQLGCSTHSGLGPKITTVSRNGLVVTVTVAHEGGSALTTPTGGAPTGFQANTASNFGGTNIAVTAAITAANTISVTFPSGTVFPVYLKYGGGLVGNINSQRPDMSNPVYDNVTYPTGTSGIDAFTGLPLVPTPDSILIN